ncbi:MAG: hypothetical protein F4X20_04220 [Dehalococcoidia bacterium]|nr:hypothetical protein [Dehalococcoidia bacterium]
MTATTADIVLNSLVEMPLLDRLELASLTGLPESTVYQAVRRLTTGGLVSSVAHTPRFGQHTKRYSLTAQGVRHLAHSNRNTVDDVLRSRPVSAQWLRLLLERLDALVIVYSVIETISGVTAPISVHLYRAHPLDAVVILQGRRTIGIIRRGRTSDRASFDRRLQKLLRGPLPGVLLFVAPDEIQLRTMRRTLARIRVPVFIGPENDVATALVDDAVWRGSRDNTRFDMQSIVGRHAGQGSVLAERIASRASLTVPLRAASALAAIPSHLLPSALTPADKRALELIADWPGITATNLRALLGLKPPLFSQITGRLKQADLLHTTSLNGRRLVLSDRALGMLARGDRSSVALARRRWGAGDAADAVTVDWRAVPGRRLRQLLRHITHTDAVHSYLASTITTARNEGWQLVQLDPPHRAARHFRHENVQKSVHPDAFLMLGRGDDIRAFFLEYERRAVRPSTMRRRLAPYLRYYSTTHPLDDHGVVPTLIVVVEDPMIVPHFRRVAHEEVRRAGVHVPLSIWSRRP